MGTTRRRSHIRRTQSGKTKRVREHLLKTRDKKSVRAVRVPAGFIQSGSAVIPDLGNRLWKGRFKPDSTKVGNLLEKLMAQGFNSIQIEGRAPVSLDMPSFDEKLNPVGTKEVDYSIAADLAEAVWEGRSVNILRERAPYGYLQFHLENARKEQEKKRAESEAEVERSKADDRAKVKRPKSGLPADMRDLPVPGIAGPYSGFEIEILARLWEPVLAKYQYKGNVAAKNLPEVESEIAPKSGLIGQFLGAEIRKSPGGYIVRNKYRPLEFKTLREAETFCAWCRGIRELQLSKLHLEGVSSVIGVPDAGVFDEEAVASIYLGGEQGKKEHTPDIFQEKYASDIKAAIEQMKREEGMSEVNLASRIPYLPRIARIRERTSMGKRRASR